MATGVLAQAARNQPALGLRGLRTSRLMLSRPAVAPTIAAIITALAVCAAD